MNADQPDPCVQHPCVIPPEELRSQCDLVTSRGSGPGGQHRNRTESAVVLVHRPTGVTAQASERRSQYENLQRALRRLRVTLAIEVRCEHAGERAPSRLWQERCRDGRISVNEHHADFATLLAEALDTLYYRRAHFQHAAEQLNCTPSQLRKLLQKEPRAWKLLNEWKARFHFPSSAD